MRKRADIVSNSKVVSLLASISSERTILLGIIPLIFVLYGIATVLQVGQGTIYLILVGLVLHFFIFSRQISTPLLYSLLFCIVVVPVFYINSVIGIMAFFAGSLFIFHHILKDEDWFHVTPLIIFYAAVILHAVFLSPLLVGDTLSYYVQLEQYTSVSEYMNTLLVTIISNPIWISGFLQKFPFVYLPFYFNLNLSSPIFIIVINGIFWMLSTLMLTRLSVEYVSKRVDSFSPRLLFTLLLISPTFILYSSQFNKEISIIFFTILSVYLFFEERYTSSFIIAVGVFYLRPYAIVAILVYIFFFKKRIYLMGSTAAGALLFLLVDTGTLLTVANSVVIFPFMFLTPLPFDIQNWLNPRAGLRPLEAVVIGMVALGSTYFVFISRKIRTEYLLIALGIGTWAFVMAWLGFFRIEQGNFSGPPYDLFVFGSHVTRKKSLIHPLIIMWVVLTIGLFRDRVLDVKLKYTS